MTRKGLGMTAIVDADRHIVGIFTDGDLRRALDHGIDVHTTGIAEVMTRGGKTVHAEQLAAEALQVMQNHKINALLVVDAQQQVVGR